MKTLFAQTDAIRGLFLVAVTAAAVLVCGCSQETSKHNLEIGHARWVRLNDEIVPDAKPAKPPTIKAETFLATGRLLESQGNFIQAAKLYQRACKTRKDYVAAWNRLGIVCDKLGRYDQAEESFLQAIKHAPKAAFLHNNLGFSCLLAGKYAKAQKHLQRALALNGQFQRARVNLGLALAKQGDLEATLAEFKRALPEAQAYYNMGYLHRMAGEWQLAGNCYKLALELDPELAEAKTSLALYSRSTATDESGYMQRDKTQE